MRKSLNGCASKPPVDDVYGRYAGVAGADGVVRPRQQFGREARVVPLQQQDQLADKHLANRLSAIDQPLLGSDNSRAIRRIREVQFPATNPPI